MTESDGIEEALEGVLRTAVMAGSQLSAQLIRRREIHLQQQQIRDQHQAKLLGERLEAEKRAALATLAQVYRSEWWDHADPQRIGDALATAIGWSTEDPAAAQAEQRIRDEIRSRYGVDAETLLTQAPAGARSSESGATFTVHDRAAEAEVMMDVMKPITKQQALDVVASTPADAGPSYREDMARWLGKDFEVDDAIANRFPSLVSDEQRATIEAERDRRQAKEGAQREEAAVLFEAASADQAPSDPPSPSYDSVERRTAEQADLERAGVEREVAKTRVQADTGFGTRATKATATADKSRAPRARISRSRGRDGQLTLPGVER